jgi:hypothetical protein
MLGHISDVRLAARGRSGPAPNPRQTRDSTLCPLRTSALISTNSRAWTECTVPGLKGRYFCHGPLGRELNEADSLSPHSPFSE